MRKPAKIATHAGVVIRFDKGNGQFSADGFDGETWATIVEAKQAIDKASDNALEIPAYLDPGHRYGDHDEELEEVTIVGAKYAERHGYGLTLRLKRGDGRLDTNYGRDLFPRTPEVLEAWTRARAKRLEANRLTNSAHEIEEKLPRIVDVDEKLKNVGPPRRR